jgi:hypothetical protein
MARYVAIELRDGFGEDGHVIVGASAMAERRRARVRVDRTREYALGLFVSENHQLTCYEHGGATFGFTADMIFCPEIDVGLVTLVNAGEAAELRSAIRQRLFELVLDVPSDATRRLAAALADRRTRSDESMSRLNASPERAQLENVLGRYSSPDLGEVTIRFEAERLVLDAGEWQSRLAIARDDAAAMTLLDPPATGLVLRATSSSAPSPLRIECPQHAYTFSPTGRGAR